MRQTQYSVHQVSTTTIRQKSLTIAVNVDVNSVVVRARDGGLGVHISEGHSDLMVLPVHGGHHVAHHIVLHVDVYCQLIGKRKEENGLVIRKKILPSKGLCAKVLLSTDIHVLCFSSVSGIC